MEDKKIYLPTKTILHPMHTQFSPILLPKETIGYPTSKKGIVMGSEGNRKTFEAIGKGIDLERTTAFHEMAHTIFDKFSEEEKIRFAKKLGNIGVLPEQLKLYKESVKPIERNIAKYIKEKKPTQFLERPIGHFEKELVKKETPSKSATRLLTALEIFPRMMIKKAYGWEE